MSTAAELLDILVYPDPFLSKPARALTPEELAAGRAEGWSLADLAARMVQTMIVKDGVGLAATQVGVGLRLFVVNPVAENRPEPLVVFNPVLSAAHGSIVAEEGCLSVPDVRAKVKRHRHIHLTGVDEKGQPVALDASDLLARVCQHETDHLDGVLFIQRVGMTAKLAIRRKLIELEEDYALKRRRK